VKEYEEKKVHRVNEGVKKEAEQSVTFLWCTEVELECSCLCKKKESKCQRTYLFHTSLKKGEGKVY
jgi:hypothetical protein